MAQVKYCLHCGHELSVSGKKQLIIAYRVLADGEVTIGEDGHHPSASNRSSDESNNSRVTSRALQGIRLYLNATGGFTVFLFFFFPVWDSGGKESQCCR